MQVRPQIKYKTPKDILAVVLKVIPAECFASFQFCIVCLRLGSDLGLKACPCEPSKSPTAAVVCVCVCVPHYLVAAIHEFQELVARFFSPATETDLSVLHLS